MIIKIDSHVHFLLSKYQTAPNWADVKNSLNIAALSGLDAVCITEHIEALGYEPLMRGLFIDNQLNASQGPNGEILYNDVAIFPGAELELADKSNIGVHADLPTLLTLNRAPGSYTIDSLYEALRTGNTPFKLVAHHIFWPGKTPECLQGIRSYVDAIEVPAKDLVNAERYINLARELKLVTTGGSDAHTFIQIGACCTLTDIGDCASLRQEDWIRSRTTRHSYSEQSSRLVAMAKIHRQSLVRETGE